MYIHYCNTHYDISPPIDINPLILQRFSDKVILVLCARDGQVKRINNLTVRNPDLTVIPCGWWNLQEFQIFREGKINRDVLNTFDVIVILDRTRIHKTFMPHVEELEEILKCSLPTPVK
jgi:hypothetical protein